MEVLRIGGIIGGCSKSNPLGFVDTSRSIQSVYGVSQIKGTFWAVPVYWGLYWVLPISGNYHA